MGSILVCPPFLYQNTSCWVSYKETCLGFGKGAPRRVVSWQDDREVCKIERSEDKAGSQRASSLWVRLTLL